MLWDIIRDWFVQYIFGGVTSQNVSYGGCIGKVFGNGGIEIENADTLFLPLTAYGDSLGDTISYINIGDWLSTTATIITLVLLVVMLLAMVRFIVRQVSGLFAKI